MTPEQRRQGPPARAGAVGVFLGGDLMAGRGIDQILPRPSRPRLHEPYVSDAREYIELAERLNGPIPRRAPVSYPWGDALEALEQAAPDVRLVNLETSVTTSEDRWTGKDIHYRMHPANVGLLTVAGIDLCVLANNHVLDYGRTGLVDTLDALRTAGVKVAGAGPHADEAQQPAILDLRGGGRLIVSAFGTSSSGIPPAWAARTDRAGVALLDGLSDGTADRIAGRIRRIAAPDDLAIVSLHWGGNWGYEVPDEHVRFARRLVDGGVDIVHGHSSHHPGPLEVYRSRVIVYGCGDLINDYEGITEYERFRSDVVLMYFVTVTPRDGVLAVRMLPMRTRRFRLERASLAEARWLRDILERVSRPFGTRVAIEDSGALALEWR